MSNETRPAIKPGDTVRHLPSGETWVVGGVTQTIAHVPSLVRHDRLDMKPLADFELLVSGSEADERRVLVKQLALAREDLRFILAHAETLRRGWRPLERSDVTADPRNVGIMLGREQIGYMHLSTKGPGWAWSLACERGEHEAESYDDALSALLNAENTRRAAGTTMTEPE